MKKRNYFFSIAFGISLLQLLPASIAVVLANIIESSIQKDHSFFSFENSPSPLLLTPSLLVICYFSILSGWQVAKLATLPPTLFKRLWPLAAPLWLLLLERIHHWMTTAVNAEFISTLWPIGLALVYLPFWSAFLVKSETRSRSSGTARGTALVLGISFFLGAADAMTWSWLQRSTLPADIMKDTASVGHRVQIDLYMPFHYNNRLVKPLSEPTLRIEANYPRLDGAFTMLPVYAATAQAVYKGLDRETIGKYFECNNTQTAYKRLIDGEADIFFGIGPSQRQKEYAESKGLELVGTPIAREAFVFVTHKDNPVDNLSVGQIRSIYSRKIINWRAVGGDDERILPFQRPKGFGSQTIMEEKVMRGLQMADPLHEEYIFDVSDLVLNVADYRNRKNSLGYTFRWFATAQFPSGDIKLLSVNGIAPTAENIASGRYPFSVDIKAVTARPPSAEIRALIDWLTGREGQNLIQRNGYIPLS